MASWKIHWWSTVEDAVELDSVEKRGLDIEAHQLPILARSDNEDQVDAQSRCRGCITSKISKILIVVTRNNDPALRNRVLLRALVGPEHPCSAW